MSILTLAKSSGEKFTLTPVRNSRIRSVDLLRGVVMIIIALDYIYDYFHFDPFLYESADPDQTNAALLFTRWITHYCAPVFIFLTGISAYLYGNGKPRKKFSSYLLKRGILLVFAEFFISSLGNVFNPSYPFFYLQAIGSTGVSMIVLSAMIYMSRTAILLTGMLIIIACNVIPTIPLPEHFFRAFPHRPDELVAGQFSFSIQSPVLPWIGIIAIGYYFGNLYVSGFHPEIRKTILLCLGVGAIAMFIALRVSDPSGDANHWSDQNSAVVGILLFLDVTNNPSSILFTVITFGLTMIFLVVMEKPLNRFTRKIAVFGRVPFFYYVIHICLIHLFSVIGKLIASYSWSDIKLTKIANHIPVLKSYGFEFSNVYCMWIGLVLLSYPCCKWFDRYRRNHQCTRQWLRYL